MRSGVAISPYAHPPPVTLLEEVLILGTILDDGDQGCLGSGRGHSHCGHSPTHHNSGRVRQGPNYQVDVPPGSAWADSTDL